MIPAFTSFGMHGCSAAAGCTSTASQVDFPVVYLLWLVSSIGLIGVVLFVWFGGIGIAAIPFDGLATFLKRPKKLNQEKFNQQRNVLGKRARALAEKGEEFKEKWLASGGKPRSRKDKRLWREFKQNVQELEDDHRILMQAAGKASLWKLILGIVWGWAQIPLIIFGIIIAFIWLLQIVLYMSVTPPIFGFLNYAFIWLDQLFPLLGSSLYAFFTFYLLVAIVRGNFRFGVSIPFIFELHPMKPNGTMMNSFLLNVGLLLITSIAVVQFASAAFGMYSRNTAVDVIFNVGVRNPNCQVRLAVLPVGVSCEHCALVCSFDHFGDY